MILSMFFLFLMLLIITALLFYLFFFFLPALKVKYEGVTDSLSSEIKFSDEDIYNFVKPDFSQIAQIQKEPLDKDDRRFIYKGEKNCRLFYEVYNSEYKNPRVCIGFGDCVKVCPQEAISIHNNYAQISGMCNGCGKCIDFCPQHLISLVPRVKDDKVSPSKDFKFWSSCYKLLVRVWGR